MEPTIVSRGAFVALGLPARVPREAQNEETFKAIWIDFEKRHDEIKPYSTDGAYYGISFGTDEAGEVDYLAAMAVEPSVDVPEGLVLREVPAARYAVFECPVGAIGRTYRLIFSGWLPGSSFELSRSAAVFEQYAHEGQEPTLVRIHVPLEGAG